MRSIQRTLMTAIVLIELVSALALSTIAFLHERDTVFHAFDIMLRGRADSVLGAVQDAEDADDNVMLDLADIHSPRFDQYRVQDAGGHLLGATPLADQLDAPATVPSGTFYMTLLHHRRYRVLVLDGNRRIDAGEPGGGVVRYVRILYAAPVGHVWHHILHTVFFYACSSLLVIVLSALWLLWSLRNALRPLEGLAAGAANITAGSWKLTVPARARNTTELQPVVDAMERSLAGLESSFRRQQHFVGDAAHELKTAVAVVKSSLQLLALRPRSQPEYQSGLQDIQHDVLRLEALVQQMLTLARAENSVHTTADIREIDLALSAKSVLNRLVPIAELRPVDLQLTAHSAFVAMDPSQAEILLENLLSNAIQYSRPHGTVQISVHPDGERVTVTVHDEGPGIAPQDIEHIFDRFWRGDPSRSRLTGGSGLGLAIVKAIVDQARGMITVHSIPEKGTTMEVSLPRLQPSSVQPTSPRAQSG